MLPNILFQFTPFWQRVIYAQVLGTTSQLNTALPYHSNNSSSHATFPCSQNSMPHQLSNVTSTLQYVPNGIPIAIVHPLSPYTLPLFPLSRHTPHIRWHPRFRIFLSHPFHRRTLSISPNSSTNISSYTKAYFPKSIPQLSHNALYTLRYWVQPHNSILHCHTTPTTHRPTLPSPVHRTLCLTNYQM